jgi:hypothetical protein
MMSEDLVKHLVGEPMGPPLSHEEAMAQLDKITVKVPLTHWAGMCLHPEDAALDLGVDLQQVEAWIHQKDVIAFQHKGEELLPMRQFVRGNPVKPVSGLKLILSDARDEPKVAWHWLMTPHHECDGRPPIELMREGHGEKVLELSTRSLAPPDFCMRRA